MATIIAFSGFAGSGKDTAARYLAETYHFIPVAFADPLKEMAKIAFDFSDEQLWGPSEMRNAPDERYRLSSCPWCGGGLLIDDGVRRCGTEADHKHLPEYVSPRVALQTLGTEWGRRLHHNVWVKSLFAKIDNKDIAFAKHMAEVRGLVDPTQSFSVDRWAISDMRFPNELEAVSSRGGHAVRLLRGEPQSNHLSETALMDATFPTVIDNQGSLDYLYSQLDSLMERVL